jgi:hypothetical protein
MSNWTRSNVSREQLLRVVEAGQLPPLTEAVEWIIPADEPVPPQRVRGVVRALPRVRLLSLLGMCSLMTFILLH